MGKTGPANQSYVSATYYCDVHSFKILLKFFNTMCGIIGYTGKDIALPILLGGLERLEYRGYDSAGVAVIEKGKLFIDKKVGKIRELVRSLWGKPIKGKTGIGHVRWATH
jgi:glucosamine--fructose-6-phosphate aminotransferase (isomerizing)